MMVRILAAVAAVVSAVVHLVLWFGGVKDQGVVGALFVVNVVAGLVIAVLLVLWRKHWLPLLLVVGFGAATLVAFIIATTPAGLFGIRTTWGTWYAILAAISEVAAIVFGIWAARAEGWLGKRSAHQPEH